MGDLRLANQLRAELSQRAFAYAEKHGIPVVASRGYPPVALFEPNFERDMARHGNFLTTSYTAIQHRAGWKGRLAKVHTSTRDLPSCDRGTWCELDSSCSSDALLMNIFCAPQTLRSPAVLRTLGLHQKPQPEFGFSPRVPLLRGYGDTTEVDMRLGDLLVEAKLTESDFQ